MSEYLKIPVSLHQIVEQKDLDKTDVKTSIHNMIHLITITAYNEVKHDSQFGTEIWRYDFENIYNTHHLREELRKSISKSIKKNEKRLSSVNVNLQIEQVEISSRIQNRRIKTQVKMEISGTIDKTNETFKHIDSFFIGPLSY